MWLSTVQPQALYHQPSLSAVYEPAEKFAEKASGLLSIPIKGETGNFILAFRPEEIQKVNWGGNPNEAIQMQPGTSNYHPRHSFGIWQQSVRQTSVPWKEAEIEIAEQFRNFLTGFLRNRIQ